MHVLKLSSSPPDRPRFGGTYLTKKSHVGIIFSRLGRLKTLVLKKHLCAKWAIFSDAVTVKYTQALIKMTSVHLSNH